MKNIILLFILIFGIHVSILGQDLPEVVPPSPTASELMKYGDIPVSLYTGTPNITIPIYEMAINGYKLPITLTYHASGIRVQDVGSYVGLGWSLNAGGNIGVTTIGANDEVDLYTWNSTEEQDFLTKLKAGTLDKFNFASANSPLYLQTMMEAVMNNTYNVEPDIYTFNFGQQAGKFLKATDGVFYSYPFNKIKIIREPQAIGETGYKWKLITTDGTEFFFGDTTTPLGQGNELFTYNDGMTMVNGNQVPQPDADLPTSWYLRKIKTAGIGNEISFDYSQKLEDFSMPASGSLSWKYAGGTTPTVLSDPSQGDQFATYKYEGASNIYEITSSNAIVRFYHDISRNDMTSGKLISKIEVIEKESMQVIKTFTLTYENTVDRVFLKTVQESGKPAYQFDYYSGLPDRFSKSQDYWGYYNAKSNSHMIPKPIEWNPAEWNNSGLNLPELLNDTNAAKRETNKNVVDVGSLKEIIYPTGGKTKFIYEANKYSNSRYAFDEETINTYTSKNVQSSGNETPIESTFQLVKNENISFSIDFDNYIMPSNNNEDIGLNPIIKIKNLDTNWEITWKATDKDPQLFTDDNTSLGTKKISFTEILNLIPGNYKITANVKCPSIGCIGGAIPQSSATFNYVTSFTYPEERGAYTGGLRIKSIKNYSDATDTFLVTEKNYDYRQNDGFSSGHLKYRMTNINQFDNYLTIQNSGCFGSRPTFVATPSDQSSQGVNSGHIGYGQVTEYFSGQEIGKTVYNYQYNEPIQETIIRYPYLPFYGDLFMNGSLKKKRVFKRENNDTIKVSEMINSYTISSLNKKTFEGIKVKDYRIFGNSSEDIGNPFCTDVMLINSNQIVSGYYTFDSKWYYLDETIQTQYDTDGLNPITTKTNYFYDNPTHIQLTRSHVLSSDGKLDITKNYYPDDVNSTSALGMDNLTSTEKAVIDRLKDGDLHRISTPIQTETYVDYDNDSIAEPNELLGLQRTNYKDWDSDLSLPSDTDLVLPSSVETLKGEYNAVDNTLEERINYLSYYENGNPQEVSKTDGTPIVYIWGYQEKYPIAKIENANYSEVSSQVANLQTKSNEDDDRTFGTVGKEGALRSALTALRNTAALSDAQVTTYTYDPLIGVTSITDPRGETIYYEYDDFNRLEMVKDSDGHIVSKNEYYYKN